MISSYDIYHFSSCSVKLLQVFRLCDSSDLLTWFFHCENRHSIGFKKGLYGGRNLHSHPLICIISMTLACLWKGKLSITMMEFSGRLASSRAPAASSEKCAYAKALPLFSKTLKCSIVESVKPAMTGIFLHLRHGPTIWHFSPFFDRPLDVPRKTGIQPHL